MAGSTAIQEMPGGCIHQGRRQICEKETRELPVMTWSGRETGFEKVMEAGVGVDAGLGSLRFLRVPATDHRFDCRQLIWGLGGFE
ncbi:MAG: hypothetical protein FWD68_19260 [Alphaproteobacteria bacterium]|nr:hypothetical protein [Alphaproteobacteria bacterium]